MKIYIYILMTCFAVLLLIRDYRLIQYTDILDVFVIELYSII